MSKKISLSLMATFLLGISIGFSGQTLAATHHEKHDQVPHQQEHLKATAQEMKQIHACAEKKGVKNLDAKDLNEEKKKIIDSCYRENGVVPPRDRDEYSTMKGQYY